MTVPTEKQLSSLPKWAQRYIGTLKNDASRERSERERIEEMMPWTKPDMNWWTLFNPPHRADKEINIFTCDEGGTVRLCTLGRRDYLFIGRSKERDL
jgi:hypothetical protein